MAILNSLVYSFLNFAFYVYLKVYFLELGSYFIILIFSPNIETIYIF